MLVLLAACGGGHGGSGGQGSTAPTVTVTPASARASTAQTLEVTVSVSGAAQGVVTLTSGAFSAGSQTLTGGAAQFTVPAGVLPTGADTLTANYAPSGASGGGASGTATVSVAAASAPSVTAQSTDLLISGHAFSAIPVGPNVLVSVTNNGSAGSQATGVDVFDAASPTQLSLQCIQPISPVSALGLAPPGANLAVAAAATGGDGVNRTAPPAVQFSFERNPYFHRVDGAGHQLPYIDAVTLSLGTTNLVPAKTASGESDLQARYLSFEDYTFLKAAEKLHD